MRSARSTTEINVPIERAWESVTDFAGYPQWNPFIVRVEGPIGPLAPGSLFRLHVKWLDGKWVDGTSGTTSDERMTVLEPPAPDADGTLRAVLTYEANGLLAKLGIVKATRTHVFAQRPGGPTSYETEEIFRGFLNAFVPLRKVQAGFDGQTAAMKAHLEAAR